MKIIQKGVSYSSNRLKQLFWTSLIIFNSVAIGYACWSAVQKNPDFSNQTKLFLLLIAYGGLGMFFYFIRHRFIDLIINNILGKRGEDSIANVLSESLDDRYTYIRNYKMSFWGDIDGILVGPSGVTILEVKYYSPKSFEILNGVFYRVDKNKFKRIGRKPFWQIDQQKRYLVRVFNEQNINQPYIRTLIVLAHGHLIKIFGKTHTYVVEKDKLLEQLGRDINDRFSKEYVERVVSILNK